MGFTMKKNEKYRKKCCDDVTDFRELEHDRDKADSGCFAGGCFEVEEG